MNKDQIRSRIKACKRMLSDDDKLRASAAVFCKLEQTALFINAKKVLLYHSLPDELSTRNFLEKWCDRKQIFLPRVNGENLDILPYDRSNLATGSFHIEEPQGDNIAESSEIDLVIVPAVAYDRYGNRVGRGKGYYDRLLASTSAPKIGVGYDFQLIDDTIDAEPHDVAVDLIITESSQSETHHIKQKQ